MQRGLYAIVDTKADDLVGNMQAITIHKHDAAAVRFFSDIATHENSIINKHPGDFILVRLGFLDHKNGLVPNYAEILTGTAWAAAREPKETN